MKIKKTKCPKCKQKTLVEDLEECMKCGPHTFYYCTDFECGAILDENKKDVY